MLENTTTLLDIFILSKDKKFGGFISKLEAVEFFSILRQLRHYYNVVS